MWLDLVPRAPVCSVLGSVTVCKFIYIYCYEKQLCEVSLSNAAVTWFTSAKLFTLQTQRVQALLLHHM